MAINLGGTDLPDPTSSTREYILKRAETETLGGKTRWDVMARKYKYIITWDFIDVDDYDSLEDIVNDVSAVTLTWDKYTSTASGISVLADLSRREPVTPGNQSGGFYSNVTLTLTEVSSRL